MASKQLYRVSGATSKMPVDSATVIESGDMLFNDTDDAKPADQFTYVAADLPATQANFAAKFLGVSSEASAAGDTRDVTFRQCGVFEFECASATFEKGDLVGPDDNAAPDALLNQQVIAIGLNGYGAIGRVHVRYGTATTRVKVEIFQPSMSPSTRMIPLGTHTLGAADEFVTDLVADFPFKIVSLNSIVTTIMGAGAETISLDKNATTLDDTMAIAATAPVGAVDKAVMDDATDDDQVLAGDTISMAGDGNTASGAATFWLEVRPFVMQIA